MYVFSSLADRRTAVTFDRGTLILVPMCYLHSVRFLTVLYLKNWRIAFPDMVLLIQVCLDAVHFGKL